MLVRLKLPLDRQDTLCREFTTDSTDNTDGKETPLHVPIRVIRVIRGFLIPFANRVVHPVAAARQPVRNPH